MCRVPRVQGGQELTFNGTAQLTSTTTRQVWARPPIDVDFQVLMFTSSGLIVRFLKVFEKSNYHSIKWVRYLTKASGSYQIRVGRHDFLGNLALTLAALLHLYHSFSGIGWIFHPVVVLSYSVVCGNVVLTVYMYVGGRSTEMAQFVVRVIFVVVCTWNERFVWRVSNVILTTTTSLLPLIFSAYSDS